MISYYTKYTDAAGIVHHTVATYNFMSGVVSMMASNMAYSLKFL